MLALVLSVPLIMMAPRNVGAQVVATSFEELQALVKPGDTIDVTDASGRKTKGRLGDLSASSLELLVRKTGPDGRETFVPQARLSEGDVGQILLERRDSLWNGTLIGLAPGAALGVSLFSVGYGELGGGAFLWVGGFGAAIGAAIDALIIGRTTVYYRAPGQRSSGVQVSPFVSKSAAGIQMSMRF